MDHLISIMIHQCTLPSPFIAAGPETSLCNPESTLSTDVTFVVRALEMSVSTKANTFRQKPTLFRLSSVSAGCPPFFLGRLLFLKAAASLSLLLKPLSHFPASCRSNAFSQTARLLFCPSRDSFPSPPQACYEHYSRLCRLLTAKPLIQCTLPKMDCPCSRSAFLSNFAQKIGENVAKIERLCKMGASGRHRE